MLPKLPEGFPIPVVSDTSALISLSIGKILEKCCSVANIHIPPKVRSELEEASQFNDHVGSASKQILHLIPSPIALIEVENKKKVGELIDLSLDAGEAEAIQLCLQLNINHLLIDDKEACYLISLLDTDIKLRLSTYLVYLLGLLDILSIDETEKVIDRIVIYRGWVDSVFHKVSNQYFRKLKQPSRNI